MTVRWKFEHLCCSFMLGALAGLVVGTHLYTLFTT